MKTFYLFLFLVPFSIYSQCPGATAISYKNKAKNLGPQEFSKQQAYIFLATYHAYKCECENGSPRSEQLVSMINNVVDTYSAYTKNAYGTISKVSSCKSQNGSGDANTTADTGDPNANNHGSGVTIKTKQSDIAKFISDIEIAARENGIDQNVINALIAGNNEEALAIQERNQANQNLQSLLNIDSGQSEAILAGLDNIFEKLGEKSTQKAEDFVESVNHYNKIKEFQNADGSYIAGTGFNYEANFTDKYWTTKDYEGVEYSTENSNEIIITRSQKIGGNGSFENDDFYFLTFSHPDFSVGKDFEISFEVLNHNGFDYKGIGSYSFGSFSLFISNFNKVVLSKYQSYLVNSFTPRYNEFYSGMFSLTSLPSIAPKLDVNIRVDELHPSLVPAGLINEYEKFLSDVTSISDLNRKIEKVYGNGEKIFFEVKEKYDFQYSIFPEIEKENKAHRDLSNWLRKRNKEIKKKYKGGEREKKLTELNESWKQKARSLSYSDASYHKYTLVKKGEHLHLEYEIPINGEIFKGITPKLEYKYLKENKLMFAFSTGKGLYFEDMRQKKGILKIKNLKITQN